MGGNLQFELVMIAVDRYTEPGWGTLELASSARSLAEGLQACGAIVPPRTPSDHRAETLRTFLAEWSSDRHAPGSAFMYWGGHGESTGSDHWLVASDSGCPPKRTDGLRSADLAQYLREDDQRREHAARHGESRHWTVLVLDCCGAGLGVQRLARELLDSPQDEPRGLALLGTHGDGSAYSPRFVQALAAAIDSYAENDEDIPVLGLLQDVAERLAPGADLRSIQLTRADRIANPHRLGVRLTASVDVRDELRRVLAGLQPALRAHFIPKAQGAELGELAWFFSGRQPEIRRLATWLRGAREGMFVVTGAAGSGKSALLGHVVTLADPRLVGALRHAGLLGAVADAAQPPDGVFDAIVHASAMTLADTVAELGGALLGGRRVAGPDELINALRAVGPESSQGGARGSPGDGVPRTVLVDALDEARDPIAIARELLRPLTQAGVRLVVGTRRSLREAIDRPSPPDRDLLDALGVQDAQLLVLADDPDAVANYVCARLLGSEGSPYARDRDAAARLGRSVAACNQPFLFARLAAAELLARPRYAAGPELERLLANGHRGLFAAACERLGARAETTLALLRALAFGLGRGLPRADRVWATVAEAVTSTRITAESIDAALEHAAAYITLDGEDGQSTYRLAHQTFAEHFGVGSGDTDDARRAHARIAAALLRHGALTGWRAANPYPVGRLAEHAARGASIEALLRDEHALDHVDPQRLGDELARRYVWHADAPHVAGACIRRRDELAAVTPQQRAAARALAQVQAGGDVPSRTAGDVLWPRWSTLTPVSPHMPLRAHGGWVRAAAFARLGDRAVLASAGDDGTVRVWDPEVGVQIGEPLRGHAGSVLSVAFGPLDDRVMLASSGGDGTIRLWDPESGLEIRGPFGGHAGWLVSVAFAWVGGRVVLASAGDDGTVRLWDPEASQQIGEPLRGHTGGVRSVAFGMRRDRVVLASASDDGTIRLWDPEGRTQIGEPLRGHTGWVLSLAFGLRADRVVLASASDDWTIRLWDPDEGKQIGEPLRGHTGGVTSVAFDATDDRVVMATAGDDGTIRLWDPEHGQQIGQPLRGHVGEVLSVACAVLGERAVLASTGADQTVRLWDPEHPAQNAPSARTHTGRVRSVAFGLLGDHLVLASASESGTVHLWNPDDGSSIKNGLRGHTSGALSVAFGVIDGRSVLASGGDDGTVLLWDIEEGTQIGDPLHIRRAEVRSVAFGTLSDRAVLACAGEHGTVLLYFDSDPVWLGGCWGEIRSVMFGKLGDRVVLASGGEDGTVRIWAAEDGEQIREPLRGHLGGVTSVAFGTLDGRVVLASAGDEGTVRLWDAAEGRALGKPLRGHHGGVRSVVFGTLNGAVVLASAGDDGTIRMWDPERACPIGEPLATFATVYALAYTGAILAAATDDGIFTLQVSDPQP